MQKVDRGKLSAADSKALKSNLGQMRTSDLKALSKERGVKGGARKAEIAAKVFTKIQAEARQNAKAAKERLSEERTTRESNASGLASIADPTNLADMLVVDAMMVADQLDGDPRQGARDRSFSAAIHDAAHVFSTGMHNLAKRYGPIVGRTIAATAIIAKAAGMAAVYGGSVMGASSSIWATGLNLQSPATTVGNGAAIAAAAPLIAIAHAYEKVSGRRLSASFVAAADQAGLDIASLALNWLREMETATERIDFVPDPAALHARADAIAAILAATDVDIEADDELLASFDWQRTGRMLVAMNPFHDERGRFAESQGEGGGGGFVDRVKRAFGMGSKETPKAPPANATKAEKISFAVSNDSNRVGPNGNPIVKVDGKEYMVKTAEEKTRGDREALAAELGRSIGLNIAEVTMVPFGGREVAATEWHDGAKSVSDLIAVSEAKATEAISQIPRQELERQALFDYVVGNSDSNDGNNLIDNGKLLTIDKEFGLTSDRGADATAKHLPQPLRLLTPDKTIKSFAFSRAAVDSMIKDGENIAKTLEQKGDKAAGGVRDRLSVLRDFAASDNLTAGNLELLGQLGPRR